MPVVWLIDPYRAGERSQVTALAQALGWGYEVKRLAYRKYEFFTNIFRGSDLNGIRPDQSDALQAPWPDLVITAGMRNEPVCRWIRHQSGGRTRIVHVGRPWANPECFDLVVTTPQYRLPQRPNVIQNALTLHRVSEERLADAAAQWRDHFAALPPPYTAVIVGGDSGPYALGARAACRLARQTAELVAETGGSILVTTSSRTDSRAIAALRNALPQPLYFYEWQAGDEHNPYYGLLALASQIVVTADSISMLSEACATGKPVYMFDLARGRMAMEPAARLLPADNDWRLSTLAYRLLMRWGWQRLSRDITLVHQRLTEAGRAAWLGQSPALTTGSTQADLERAVAAVRRLHEA
jgi:mitochondrial fission protein ELM1